MVSRRERIQRKQARRHAEKRYERHRRHNLVYAKPGLHDFVIVLDNLKPSFNIGKIFRSADAFGAREVHLIGTNYFDAKAAKGSFKWVPAVFHETFDQCYERLHKEGYTMIVLEPEAPKDLHQIDLPLKSAFVLGHEEFGISFDKNDYDGIRTMKIKQFGQVESLNVSIAASVVMYEYFRQHPGTEV